MDFNGVDITIALEESNFQFRKALLLLLNGLDRHRTNFKQHQNPRFRRHTFKTTRTPKNEAALFYPLVFFQYEQRILESFSISVSGLDYS